MQLVFLGEPYPQNVEKIDDCRISARSLMGELQP
jgi:hypothetical protein